MHAFFMRWRTMVQDRRHTAPEIRLRTPAITLSTNICQSLPSSSSQFSWSTTFAVASVITSTLRLACEGVMRLKAPRPSPPNKVDAVMGQGTTTAAGFDDNMASREKSVCAACVWFSNGGFETERIGHTRISEPCRTFLPHPRFDMRSESEVAGYVAERCLRGYPISIEEKVDLYTQMYMSGLHCIKYTHKQNMRPTPAVVTVQFCSHAREKRKQETACLEAFAVACLWHNLLPADVLSLILPVRLELDERILRLVQSVNRDDGRLSQTVRRHFNHKRERDI